MAYLTLIQRFWNKKEKNWSLKPELIEAIKVLKCTVHLLWLTGNSLQIQTKYKQMNFLQTQKTSSLKVTTKTRKPSCELYLLEGGRNNQGVVNDAREYRATMAEENLIGC